MANDQTPDPNPHNEPSRSPLMLIIMAAIILLGILSFFFLRGQGGGGSNGGSPGTPHKSLATPPTRSIPGTGSFHSVT